jgi:uncharacterized protein
MCWLEIPAVTAYVRGSGGNSMDEATQNRIEAKAFRRLLQHLQDQSGVQNIDLMIVADFCRNCLADWYREAAAEEGIDVSKEDARSYTHGMPYQDWKAAQPEATPEQLAAYAARKAGA